MIRWNTLTEIIQLISIGKAEKVDLSTLTTKSPKRSDQNSEFGGRAFRQ
jgi:hypothetical protein